MQHKPKTKGENKMTKIFETAASLTVIVTLVAVSAINLVM